MKPADENCHSTPLLQDWLGDDAAKRHRREVHFPSGRFGEAIEQAQAVLFLASDESSFVNGMDFVVDGGMTKVSVTHGAQLWNLGQRRIAGANVFRRHMSQLKDHQRKHRRISRDDNVRQ